MIVDIETPEQRCERFNVEHEEVKCFISTMTVGEWREYKEQLDKDILLFNKKTNEWDEETN